MQVVLQNADERDISHFFIHDDIFRKHFLSQVKELKPNHILVFSSRIGRLLEYNGVVEDLKNDEIKFQHTNHPSILRNKDKISQDIASLLAL